MKLSNKVYDILAFVGRILLPALATAYATLADALNLPFKTEVVQVVGVVTTFIVNVFLQETSKNYYASQTLSEVEQNITNYSGGNEDVFGKA